MAVISSTRPDVRVASWRTLLMLGLGLALLALGAQAGGLQGFAWVKTFSLLFGSLMISAVPFVALGAVTASAVGVFVPPSIFERIGRLPAPLQLPAAGLAGVAFPICECGSVPVARRFMLRGLAPSAALTFMLAAPIVNPVVLASTFVAYRGRGPLLLMVAGRFGLGLLTAMVVGWVVGGKRAGDVLRQPEEAHAESVPLARPEARWRRFFHHVAEDFAFMAKYLLVGAVIAAFVQTFLPQGVVARLATVPILDGLVMMGFAALLSLCSESDAFIAASVSQFGFGPASQLAFLVFGPMVDLKLVAMYGGTFRPRVVRAIVVTAMAMTLAGSMWLRVISG